MDPIVSGSRAQDVVYVGPALDSNLEYYVRMKFVDDEGLAGPFSTASSFGFSDLNGLRVLQSTTKDTQNIAHLT